MPRGKQVIRTALVCLDTIPLTTNNIGGSSEIPVDRHGRVIILPSMQHAPGFLKLVNEARPRVKEITVADARERLSRNPQAVLLDVREDSEWLAGHAAQAVHLGKGVLERDLEKTVPALETEIIMYCGGGYRSVLTADAAQRMGYHNVFSLIGGYKGLLAANWPMAQ
jgi:rhodanese-related sulfurtransferase